MDPHSRQNIAWFLGGVKRHKRAYSKSTLSFVASFENDRAKLVAGQLILSPVSVAIPEKTIRVRHFVGCRFDPLASGLTIDELFEKLINGRLITPMGEVELLRNTPNTQPISFHRPAAQSSQTVQFQIMATGLSERHNRGDEEDWLLRSANPPFAGLSDMLAEFGLLHARDQFEAVAIAPIAIDVDSRVSGETANIKIRVAKRIPRRTVSVRAIVHGSGGGVVARRAISNRQFSFAVSEEAKDVIIGSVSIDVPQAAIVNCAACIEDEALHWLWIGDPESSQNPLRAICEVFDPGLEIVSGTLTLARQRANPHDHQTAAAILFWILGFAPLHLGQFKAFSDAPDVIAMSSDGHVIVAECTTGGLKTDNKLQHLIDRKNMIRDVLRRINRNDIDVIPVMVTSRLKDDISDDIRDYERRGVVVFTNEDVEPLLFQTAALPESSARFQELKKRLHDAVQIHRIRDEQPSKTARDVEAIKRRLNDDV